MIDVMQGSFVYAKNLKRNVKVIGVKELWGYKSYLVLDSVSNKVFELAEIDIDPDVDERRSIYEFKYVLNASKVKNMISGGILPHIGGSILPLPHQIYALKKALSSNNIRYILADEVGLGKTIEAGLILKELKLRGLVRRILVLVPKGLVLQWKEELKEKFNEEFRIILPQDFDAIRRIHGEGNIWAKFDQVITSHDSVKPIENRPGWDRTKVELLNKERFLDLVSAGWDLIIIDEAHRLAGSSTDVARFRLGKALSSSSPYLLLLTATPHQGKTDAFLRLMRFLDEKAFPNEKAIDRKLVSPFIIRTEKREAIDFKGEKLFKNRYTKIISVKWKGEGDLQKILYERVTDYVARGYNRAVKERKNYIGFLMVLMQRLVTSSTRAIREYIEKRLEVLKSQRFESETLDFEEFYDGCGEEILEKLISTYSMDVKKEIAELEEILSIAKQAERQFFDIKLDTLFDLLFKVRLEESDAKFLIFTEFRATQDYLREMLHKKGYKVVVLNGSMDIEERKAALKEFEEAADIMVSTDAGGEGLNLQFCHIVINYDMPWNPMKVEQRIGRVDRIGQTKDVFVFNFILEETIENRVRRVLEEKLDVIFRELGIDKMSDVLDSFEAGIDFTETFIKSIANPELLEFYIDKVSESVKEKAKVFSNVRELLKKEKEWDIELLEALPSRDIEDYLNGMCKNYALVDEECGKELRGCDLNDERVRNLLNLPEFAFSNKVPVVKAGIRENGYWSLWEVSVNNSERYCKIFPIFINEQGDYKPASSKALYDFFLKEEFEFEGLREIEKDVIDNLREKAMEIAYNYFSEMKDKFSESIREEAERKIAAINLRKEAAMRIGLEAVRKHRLSQLEAEERALLEAVKRKENIIPGLKLLYVICLEVM